VEIPIYTGFLGFDGLVGRLRSRIQQPGLANPIRPRRHLPVRRNDRRWLQVVDGVNEMELRVTQETDTFVYATSPLRLAGLDPEDYLVAGFPLAVLKTAELNPILSLLIAGFCLWLYKEMSDEQPPGFLSVAVALFFGRLVANPAIQKVEPVYRVVHWTVKKINDIWISSGLLPLPNYSKRYER